MMFPDLTGQVCLITGGTRGVGLSAGLELARRQAQVVLTYNWGEHDEGKIIAWFQGVGGKVPLFVKADAGDADDANLTMEAIRARFGRLDLFVSNVCVAARGGSLAAYRKRDLAASFRASVWPLETHLAAAGRVLGKAPTRTIAMSSDGPDHHYPQYDYVAIAKAALEALAMSRNGTSRVFILRARQVTTQSFSDMFPADAQALLERAFAEFEIPVDAVGKAVVALASGDLDPLAGQVLSLDRGAAFMDNTLTAAPALMGSADG